MSTVIQVLKSEIQRLAKKEVKIGTALLKKDNARLKRDNAMLKRRMASLLKAVQPLLEAESKRHQQPLQAKPEEAATARFTARNVRAMRKKLRLNKSELARLLDVVDITVAKWEKSTGRLRLRQEPLLALTAAQKLTAKEAKARLALLQEKAAAQKPVKAAKAVKKAKTAKTAKKPAAKAQKPAKVKQPKEVAKPAEPKQPSLSGAIQKILAAARKPMKAADILKALNKAGIKKGVQAVSMALAIQKKVFKKVAQGVYTLA